jgi:Riboflavin kinase
MEQTLAPFEGHHTKFSEKPDLPPRPLTSNSTANIPARKPVGLPHNEKGLIEKANDLKLDTFQSPPPLYEEDAVLLDSPSLVQSPMSVSTSDSPTSEPSKWRTTMEDARHFAGGLISHPFESTKHFSILRHSHGLVYYKGPSTNLAITIFSDMPLPEDRTLWVQRKGWTGKTGMKVKSLLRSNSSWIDVTPSERAEPAQLPPSDERAWQRDISKFLKKAPKDIRHHVPRETDVLRIPASVGDGYFRVVLCAGEGSKNVLCPSPVFRVASTSTSGSSIKGASLSTLPIEIGVKVLSSTAITAAENVIAPVASAIQDHLGQLKQHEPGFLAQEAASIAYDAAGVQNKIDNANQQFRQTRDMVLESDYGNDGNYDKLTRSEIVGSADGPESPFPIRMSSKLVSGTGRSTAELGVPTMNLAISPEDIDYHLQGVYFGWASISAKASLPPGMLDIWHPAIITVAPCPYAAPSITPKKVVKAHLLHDFQGTPLQQLDSKISLLILGFLHPAPSMKELDRDWILNEIANDIGVTQASLNPEREAWSAEACINQLELTKTNRSMTERYVDLLQSGQRQVDRVPLHKVGIRAPGAVQRDKMVVYGNGGVYVLR